MSDGEVLKRMGAPSSIDILHVMSSTTNNESRMLKETLSAMEHCAVGNIEICGRIRSESIPEEERLDNVRSIWRCRINSPDIFGRRIGRVLGLPEWMLRVCLRYRKARICIVQTHSLLCLPLGYLLKLVTGAKLLYDAHELETEVDGESGYSRLVWRYIEKTLARKADAVMVVGKKIATWYEDNYGVRPVTVRNVPLRTTLSPTRVNSRMRETLRIPAQDRVFIYAGGLTPGRGVEFMLTVFTDVPAGNHLVFMGYGVLEEEIRTESLLFPNIHFVPSVPLEQVLSYLSEADISLCSVEDICLSYRYCLPNKLFESLMAGVPVLANADLEEVRKIVESYSCGWMVPLDVEKVRFFISTITTEDIASRRRGALQAASELAWEDEVKPLIQLYDRWLSNP